MKILEVTHRYHPNTGGVEEHVKQISERLADRHDVTVLSADADGWLDDESTINNVRVVRDYSLAPGSNLHFNPLSKVPIDPDVVHVHNYHSFPAHFHAFKAENVVFTPHYHGRGSSFLTDAMLSMLKPFGRHNIRSADAVIAMTDWEQVELQSDFGAINVEVIPHGMPEIDAEGNPGPYLFVVSRLEKYKNVDLAIKSMLLHDYNLVIVGDGPQKLKLQELAEQLGVRQRCSFHGHQSRDELERLYANAAVTLNLSELEAFGMTVAESLAAGTPVVLLPEKGLLRWAGIKGVIYATKTVETVADSIELAAGLPVDRHPLPSWDKVASRTEEVLINAR